MYTHLFFFLLLSITIAVSYAATEDEKLRSCSGEFYSCGQFQNLTYPFWGDNRPQFCGHKDFNLTCYENEYPIIHFHGVPFRIHQVSQSTHAMKLSRFDLRSNFCTVSEPRAGSFNLELFQFGSDVKLLSIYYDCDDIPTEFPKFSCDVQGRKRIGFCTNDYNMGYVAETLQCGKFIDVPVSSSGIVGLFTGSENIQEVLDDGFAVEYSNAFTAKCSRCEGSGGVCGSDPSGSELICLCPEPRDQTDQPICSTNGTNGRKKWLMVAIASAASAIGVAICVHVWRRRTKNDPNLEALIKQHGYMALKRYSYSNIKKMTNSLKHKLGQGGYGSVYKGKLPDGQLVAVKILNVSKGNGEDFINEVASISRTSHVNVVTLKGYCLQGRKTALVYDFMPRGSLEKFLCNKSTGDVGSARLDWETLYKIIVGIARGLEYLHSGCNTRILHFDIKPHNILLDEDFCPKISDFGLAKLCTGKESIVSMVGTRGTVGYIAPEVFCRNFGGVSYKSDVYSYGMMVLEMVGARKKLKNDVDGSSECYFPQWIYKRLEAGGDLELQDDLTKEENELTKKMTMVGLWCIQTHPSQRPTMGRVLEMLEGSVERLEFPPQPFLSSPSKLVEEYSTTVTSS